MARGSLAVFVWLILCLQFSSAQTLDPVFGYGMESCGTWLADRTANNADAEENWVAGYLSGAVTAIGAFKNAHVTYYSDLNGAFYWIDNDCHARPTEELEIAAARFVGTSGSFVTSKEN